MHWWQTSQRSSICRTLLKAAMPHVGANSCILFGAPADREKNSYLEEHRALFIKAKDDLEEESREKRKSDARAWMQGCKRRITEARKSLVAQHHASSVDAKKNQQAPPEAHATTQWSAALELAALPEAARLTTRQKEMKRLMEKARASDDAPASV